MPLALLFLRDTLRGRASAVLGFLAGFVVGALPLLALNIWVRGQPLHTGLTPYMIGWFATNTFDWDNFLATYDLWPLSRLVRERPADLLRLLYHHAQFLLMRPEVRTGVVLVPLALAWVLPRERRRAGVFLAVIMVLYLGAIMLPSTFSFRAIAPVTCLLCVLAFPALARLAEYLPGRVPVPPPRRRPRGVDGGGDRRAVRGHQQPAASAADQVHRADVEPDRARHDARPRSPRRRAGLLQLLEVLPARRPAFVTFHNYGGYMLLDPLYNATMPRPEAQSAAEWQAFFDRHDTEFVVARPTPAIRDFLDHRDPALWPEIHRDDRGVVFKRSAGADSVTAGRR